MINIVWVQKVNYSTENWKRSLMQKFIWESSTKTISSQTDVGQISTPQSQIHRCWSDQLVQCGFQDENHLPNQLRHATLQERYRKMFAPDPSQSGFLTPLPNVTCITYLSFLDTFSGLHFHFVLLHHTVSEMFSLAFFEVIDEDWSDQKVVMQRWGNSS